MARADPARTLQVRFSQRRPERRWRRHGRERGLAHGKRSPVCLRSREETDGGAGRRGRQDGARARGETRFWGRAFGLHVPALASQLCDHCQLLTQSGPRSPPACVGHSPESHRPHRVRGAARSPRRPCALCRCSSELGRRSEVQRPLGAPASPHSSSCQGTGKEAGSSGRRCPATAERAAVEEGSPLPLALSRCGVGAAASTHGCGRVCRARSHAESRWGPDGKARAPPLVCITPFYPIRAHRVLSSPGHPGSPLHPGP